MFEKNLERRERDSRARCELASLWERAEYEPDVEFAKDLKFAAEIAAAFDGVGGRALVVGGYVRDAIIEQELGVTCASKDIDIEVYGLGFDEMSEILGCFGRVDHVGSSFGIAKLTNVETGNILDFSIPREDSKVDVGHRGFNVTGNPNMSVRDAARRRDLTINALAMNPLTGEIIDEFGGISDVRNRVLKATDPERFVDDPLWVLRVAQFAGRFGFEVDEQTAELCRGMDLRELPRERIGEVWMKLMTKAKRPSRGLEAMNKLGVLDKLHSEIAVLDSIEQDPKWHPEGNVWEHTKFSVDAAAQLVRDIGLDGDERLVVLFGALCHDIGKATTTTLREKGGVMRLTSRGHAEAGVEPARSFLHGIGMKMNVIDMILPIVREHMFPTTNPDPTDKSLLRLAVKLQPANMRLLHYVSSCDINGRGSEEYNWNTASKALFERLLGMGTTEKPVAAIVNGRDLIASGMTPGRHFGDILRALYDAQISGAFMDLEGGLEYMRSNILEA